MVFKHFRVTCRARSSNISVITRKPEHLGVHYGAWSFKPGSTVTSHDRSTVCTGSDTSSRSLPKLVNYLPCVKVQGIQYRYSNTSTSSKTSLALGRGSVARVSDSQIQTQRPRGLNPTRSTRKSEFFRVQNIVLTRQCTEHPCVYTHA